MFENGCPPLDVEVSEAGLSGADQAHDHWADHPVTHFEMKGIFLFF